MLAKFINNNPTSLQETTSENQSCFNLRCIINELYNTMKQRKIDKITSNPWRPGFLGEGHTAKAVVGGQDFEQTDPFIILMDDRVNLPGNESAGGPHPHAGFETVTFVLEGNGREFKTGSVELMTAGKGIVHTEEIKTKTDMRILQLWLALPPGKRWAEPFHQEILAEDTPTLRTANTEIKVYSGSSHGLTSPMINHTMASSMLSMEPFGYPERKSNRDKLHGWSAPMIGKIQSSSSAQRMKQRDLFFTLPNHIMHRS